MTVPSPTLADLVALLETAIEFGHVQAYPGLGHAKRDWRDCPQTLCRNVHSAIDGTLRAAIDGTLRAAIDGTLRAALAESPARSREEPGLDVERRLFVLSRLVMIAHDEMPERLNNRTRVNVNHAAAIADPLRGHSCGECRDLAAEYDRLASRG